MTRRLDYEELFLSEAQDILDALDAALVTLERTPGELTAVHEAFRQTHTLKSMAQTMEYDDMSSLSHCLETTLGWIRSGSLPADEQAVSVLFSSIDALRSLVENVRAGEGKVPDVAALMARHEALTPGLEASTETALEQVGVAEEPLAHVPSKSQTVRIPLSQLDDLMNVTGELVINRIRLTQVAQRLEDAVLDQAVAQMASLTGQLQDAMMQARLVPLEHIFVPYTRLMRDLAAAQGKEIDFEIVGADIGLDRAIQDEINEPLLHLLKNAVAHGMEDPTTRIKQGKPQRGRVVLSAERKQNAILIRLSDDGRGIDVAEVAKNALQRNLATAEELAALSPDEVLMFITSPGYSGAREVTKAAGRGVGLNVVKTKVDRFGGELRIETQPRVGTTFTLRLPLSMAIIQAMLVGVASESYCIPLSFITETIKVRPDEIKTIEHHEVVVHRGSVLPLIRLAERLGFRKTGAEEEEPSRDAERGGIPVVIVEAGSKRAGLVVDTLLGQQEAVVKPLTGLLAKLAGASGATILGTGRVALIVDVPSLL